MFRPQPPVTTAVRQQQGVAAHTTPLDVSQSVLVTPLAILLTGCRRLALLQPCRSDILPAQVVAGLQAARQVGRRRVGGVPAVGGAPVPLQRRLVQPDTARPGQLVLTPAGQAGRPDVIPWVGRQLELGPPLAGSPLDAVTELGEVEGVQLLGEGHRVAARQDTRVVHA